MRRAWFLFGPTASGKTAVAHWLAERAGAAVVSADAMLVYRGMDIGTAKPLPAERGDVPYLGPLRPGEKINDKGYITHDEIDKRMAELGAPSMTPHPQKPETLSPFAEQMIDVLWKGTPHDLPAEAPPAFDVGATVRVRNIHDTSHNRLPGYLNRATGVIAKQYGAFHDPAASAHQQTEVPHQLYMVRFTSTELWGAGAVEEFDLYADLFEDYLEAAE